MASAAMVGAGLWLVGGLVAVVWVLIAQLRIRPVRLRLSVVYVVVRWVLLAYGVLLIGLVARSQSNRRSLDLVSVAILSCMAALAIGLGVARGVATRVWAGPDGRWYRRGGVAVVALWFVSLAAHLGLDWLLDRHSGIGGIGEVTTLAFLVTTISAQNMTVRGRVRRHVATPAIR